MMEESGLERLEHIMANLRTVDDVAGDAVASLKEALASQEASAAKLGERIWWLNVWLLVITVAIFALTTVQVAVALRWIGR
jgi:hypothetical protein